MHCWAPNYMFNVVYQGTERYIYNSTYYNHTITYIHIEKNTAVKLLLSNLIFFFFKKQFCKGIMLRDFHSLNFFVNQTF